MLRQCVFGAVNDAKIFAATAFDAWLNESTAALLNETQRLHNHTFLASLRVFRPPINRPLLACRIDKVHFAMFGRKQQSGIGSTQRGECLHVPEMVAIEV